MELRLFQIDAFASEVFRGNPAAVCPLEEWLPAEVMQRIALENNLSETAFFVREDSGYRIRWFTPTTEVELCGHATLASAYVIWEFLGGEGPLRFDSHSGTLSVARDGERIVLDFPARPPQPSTAAPPQLVQGLGPEPQEILADGEAAGSGFYLVVYGLESEVRSLNPDMGVLSTLGRMGVVPTAPGGGTDFVSRCFAPTFGIDEDPVTGSTHCFLMPYWARRLGRNKLHARQVSQRGGDLYCELAGDRVFIGGNAACYMQGRIALPEVLRPVQAETRPAGQ